MAQATLRRETAKIVTLADADLTRLWRLVDAGASAETALRDLLPAIVTEYGQVGAALAAEWYDEQRLKAGVGRRFVAEPIAATDRGSQALVGWALTEANDDAALKTLILGGVQRRILDHSRLTVTQAAVRDPSSEGWVRVGQGECAWCQQYLDGVVRTVAYDFPAHDNCNCEAVVAF